MDLNHRSPGYEPDGISRLPHLAEQKAKPPPLQPTDTTQTRQDARSGAFLSSHAHLPFMRNGVLLVLLLLSASLAGCTGASDDGGEADGVDLKVYYDETSGVVEQTWRNGQQTGSQTVTLTFDFARVTSTDDPLVAFLSHQVTVEMKSSPTPTRPRASTWNTRPTVSTP